MTNFVWCRNHELNIWSSVSYFCFLVRLDLVNYALNAGTFVLEQVIKFFTTSWCAICCLSQIASFAILNNKQLRANCFIHSYTNVDIYMYISCICILRIARKGFVRRLLWIFSLQTILRENKSSFIYAFILILNHFQ